MKQGIQESFKGVNEDIHLYGCYFLDILRWAELDTGKDFGVVNIIALHKTCKDRGYIGNECYIKKAHEVYNLAADVKKYTAVSVRQLPVDKDEKFIETYIVCNKKPMYTHFTLCYKGQLWDSLPPDRAGAKAYKADSYRVLV